MKIRYRERSPAPIPCQACGNKAHKMLTASKRMHPRKERPSIKSSRYTCGKKKCNATLRESAKKRVTTDFALFTKT